MNFDSEQISIGVDIEEISRFDKYAGDKSHPVIKRVFTDYEIEYCYKSSKPSPHLCVRFCAKEAFYKAFCSFGIKIPNLREFEIFNGTDGVPKARLLNEYAEKFDLKVSLSHSRTAAIAQVLISAKRAV